MKNFPRTLLFTALVQALFLLFPPHGAGGEKPNIVLFLVDDMGWMDTSAYGSEYYDTPNMKRFAGEAMRFTDAYAVPLCSPTRATILSGQYSPRHGVTSASGHQPAKPAGAPRYPEKAAPNAPLIYPLSKNYLDPDIVTLALVLRDGGYRTAHLGKWHLGTAPEHRPAGHGFETTWFCVPDPGPPSYFSPYGVVSDGKPGGQSKIGNITDGPEGEYITDRLTDEALRFIDEHQDGPFFLNLWHYGVHGPWGHKEEYTAEFAKKTDPRGEQRNPIMASMLKSVDDSLGRILDRLDELGLSEKTLFLFYSDNGGNTHSNTPDSRQMTNIKPGHPKFSFVEDWRKWAGEEAPTNNAPLREGKGRIYEGGQRVPLMVRWPGKVEAGSVSNEVVTAVDLYPTILEAAGLEKPDRHILDGLSLLPVVEGRGTLEREAVFTWFPHLIPAASVRAGDFKLIRRWEPHRDYPDLLELYDLSRDIGETRNLAAEMPEKVAELEALLDRFIEETGALVPKPNPAYQRPKESGAAANADPAFGLVPKQCRISVADGILRVEELGRVPFLGTVQVKVTGPVELKLRMRGEQGGSGRVQWRSADQEVFPEEGQVVSYTLSGGGEWEDIRLSLPVKGKTGTIRLYLPASESALEIDSIEFSGESGSPRRWDFLP